MKKKGILALSAGLALLMLVTSCTTKPVKKPTESSKETSVETTSKEKEEKTLNFTVKLKSFDPKTSTPLIVKVKEDKKETYVVPKVTPKEKSKTEEYTVETPISSENAEVTLFVPPVNADGSMYEIPKEPIKEDKEKSVELKLIAKDKVTEEQIKTVLDNTKKAVENGCDELTINEKNKLMEKQVENTNKADVKKVKETAKPEKVKETGKETEASTKNVTSIAVEKDPVTEVKPTKPAPVKPNKPASNPAPVEPNKPAPAPEKKKVWVEPVYEYIDKYEEQPVYKNVTETYTEPVTKQVIDQPEQTVKHEKWEIDYYFFYASSQKKAYNENDYKAEAIRLIDIGEPENATLLSEYHEGSLENPDFYQWKTDISTYETIPATYKTITENVTKTRTVKKQTGTKKVKVGTEKKLIKEGYWKYE